MRDLVFGGRGYQEYERQRRLESARRMGRDVRLTDYERNPVEVLLAIYDGIPVRLRDEDGRRVVTLRPKARKESTQ